MKKIVLLAAVAALFVGMLGVPASADPIAGVGVFEGQAVVGKVPGACTKGEPFTNPSGKGIGIPLDLAGTPKGPGEVHAYWRLNTNLTGAGLDNTTPSGPTFNLDACGKLRGVAGIGAACGMSNGYDGIGRLRSGSATGSVVAQFRDMEWPASVGGTLPVTGVAENTAKTKQGTLVAVVQAQGAAGCIAPNKAQSFQVVGTATFA